MNSLLFKSVLIYRLSQQRLDNVIRSKYRLPSDINAEVIKS
ncbi:hypothetical protein [Rouxiella badensis]|nr:hypothetical protein [Rouxiella badensis]